VAEIKSGRKMLGHILRMEAEVKLKRTVKTKKKISYEVSDHEIF
jgi:hypothetical protein